MRFFEFGDSVSGSDKFLTILRNYIGRAASQKAPSKLNWRGLNAVLKSSGFDLAADYETFKSMYDSNPTLQNIVKNFDQTGIELNVPGQETPTGEPSTQDSEEVVAKMAAGAVDQQISQNQSGVQV